MNANEALVAISLMAFFILFVGMVITADIVDRWINN